MPGFQDGSIKMAKIVYQVLETGEAVNLMMKSDDYELQEGEFSLEGDRLPDINALHAKGYVDPAEVEALIQSKIQDLLREQAITALKAEGKIK